MLVQRIALGICLCPPYPILIPPPLFFNPSPQGSDDVSFAILFVFIVWDYIPTTLLVITITSKSLGERGRHAVSTVPCDSGLTMSAPRLFALQQNPSPL